MTRRAIHAHPAGSWDESRSAGTVTLAYEDRFRRRIRLTDDGGEPFLLDLPRAQVLAEGDGLELEEGGYLHVRAAAEQLMEVHCHDTTELARVAWHLGNRHLPVEIREGRVRLPYDHVIADMLHGLGAHVHRIEAPFTPESGAYSGGGHHHHHDHEH